MTPARRGHRGGGAMANAGICTEASVNHCGVHCNTPDIGVVYRLGLGLGLGLG